MLTYPMASGDTSSLGMRGQARFEVPCSRSYSVGNSSNHYVYKIVRTGLSSLITNQDNSSLLCFFCLFFNVYDNKICLCLYSAICHVK